MLRSIDGFNYLQALSVLRDEIRDRIVAHEELTKLIALSDKKIDRFVDFAAGEVNRADKVFLAGRDPQVSIRTIGWHRVELPGLPSIEQPQAIGFDTHFVQINHAGCSEILLDPRILDGADRR